MIDYPNKLNLIFDRLDKYNIKPIIIGGFVRDKLLNVVSKDIDIELYGLDSFENLEKILEEFGDVNSVGKSFGVCKLKFQDLDLDFSLPREDSKISSGHKGFLVSTDNSLDFKTATSRRDFTINAMGFDVREKKLLDPFNGLDDLRDKILRAVDISKFDEDPLRVLRAAQFASRFKFKLDSLLFDKCKKMMQAGVLNELPKERIFQEIKKLLLKSDKPSFGILLLQEMRASLYFKMFASLKKKEFQTTLDAVDYLTSLPIKNTNQKLTLMLSLLSYYFSQKTIVEFLTLFTNKRELIKEVSNLVLHKNAIDINKFSDVDIYTLATKVNIELFLHQLNSITLGSEIEKIENIKNRAATLDVLNTKAPEILQGKDLIQLGLKPSSLFSKHLDAAYKAQINSEFVTHDEAILWLEKYINSSTV